MKLLLRLVTLIFLCSVWLGLAAKESQYLFDLLKQKKYQKTWNGLIQNNLNAEGWLKKYGKTLSGPSAPNKFVDIGGTKYLLAFVCQTHDCADNQFAVLFTLDGKQAWGLYFKNRSLEYFFGNPDTEKTEILRTSFT
jgi:Inhibitor of vertebrate lysozyme (Ivy)